MVAVLIVLLLFFTIYTKGNFFSPFNITNIINQSCYLIVASLGMLFVMLVGGMDLSIGYQISLYSVICGLLMRDYGWGTLQVALICMLLGVVMGYVNGLLSEKLHVFSLIITLATAYSLRGISSILSHSETIRGFPDSFSVIGSDRIFSFQLGSNPIVGTGSVTWAMLITAVIVIVVSFILNKTYFGRYIYGIGGNAEAMRLAGVNVQFIKMTLFAICGFLTAISALILASRTGSVNVNTGVGTEFSALTACVVGGVAVQGGMGKVWGLVVGVFVVNVLSNGMQIMEMGQYPQYVAKGIVLIVAVGFDVYQKTAREKVYNREPQVLIETESSGSVTAES
jgi:Ribose/xylose/arabinose/galactoside ABC-type transport systems, permease components